MLLKQGVPPDAAAVRVPSCILCHATGMADAAIGMADAAIGMADAATALLVAIHLNASF